MNYDPPSIEKYTAEKQAVVQLLGEDKVYWAGGGEVYHVCANVPDLSKSAVTSGTTAEAVADGKPRLTLKLESELKACQRAVPNNIDEIVDAIRRVQQGEVTEQVLPSPDWTGVANAPERRRPRRAERRARRGAEGRRLRVVPGLRGGEDGLTPRRLCEHIHKR